MKETDMLNAWIWDKHQTDLQWRRVRVGTLPTKELARMYSVILRWVDAIIVSDGVIYLVEAKLRADPGALGQLDLYEKLLRVTPEFEQYRNYPVQKVLLAATTDLNMVELCSEKGVLFEVFSEEEVNKVRRKLMLPIV